MPKVAYAGVLLTHMDAAATVYNGMWDYIWRENSQLNGLVAHS